MAKRKVSTKKSAQAVLTRWLDLDRDLVIGQKDHSRGVILNEFASGHHVELRTIQRDLEKFNAIGQLTKNDWVRGHFGHTPHHFYKPGIKPLFPPEVAAALRKLMRRATIPVRAVGHSRRLP